MTSAQLFDEKQKKFEHLIEEIEKLNKLMYNPTVELSQVFDKIELINILSKSLENSISNRRA